MKSTSVPTSRVVMGFALAGVLATSTLAFAQTSVADTGSGAQQQSATTGGWKRVGDQSQVYNPDQNQNTGQNPTNQPSANPAAGPDQSADPNRPGSYPQTNGAASPSPAGQYGYPPANTQAPPTNGQYNPQNGGPQNYPPPPPVPAQLTLQPGTYLTVRINQTLSSDKNQPGDSFTATLAQPLVVNGVVVAEPGQTVGGRVIAAEKHHFDNPARLGLALTNLTLVDGQQIPVNTQFVSRQGGSTPGGQQVGTVAATTGVGAAIGAAAGWGTGAAIGAGAGAAAGLIGVLVTRNHASVLYPEQVLTFKTETPVTISTTNSSQAFRYVQPNEYDRPVYANGAGNGMYESGSPAPPVYDTYASGYPYYGYGYGYPYYWGPSFAFYGGYWGGRWYPRGYYGGRSWGGRYYGGGRGFAGGGRGFAGGGRGFAGGGSRGGGGHGGGGHR